MTASELHLVDRRPVLDTERLVAQLVPPPRFSRVRFDNYLPAVDEPSQSAAVRALEAFAVDIGCTAHRRQGHRRRGWREVLTGRGTASDRLSHHERPGVYLDGGFGVGKTHLLASLWHAVRGPKAYGTFVEYTNLVGALGFRAAVQALSGYRFVGIDEFELDDPGDTVLVSRLVRELAESGARLGATSNTLPDALGEGRFAAADFVREIQGMADKFQVLRIDGEDFRHRGLPQPPAPLAADTVRARAGSAAGASLDDFGALMDHLSRVHPSRYGALLDDVTEVCLLEVRPVSDQAVALRLVVLADRLYDRDLPLLVSGTPLDQLFPEEMMRGGYRKKYARAVSRLTALAREGAALLTR